MCGGGRVIYYSEWPRGGGSFEPPLATGLTQGPAYRQIGHVPWPAPGGGGARFQVMFKKM